MDTNATSVEAFLTLSPEAFGAFTSPPPPSFAAQDYVFAQPTTFESPSSSSSLHSASSSSTNSISLAFPQVSHEYPPLMSPEIMQLFGNSSADLMFTSQVPPFMMVAHDFVSHPITLSFPPELLAQVATPTVSQNGQLTGQCTIVSHPHLDLKGECPSEAPWLSYMQEVLSHPLPFQSSLSCATISPKATELSPSSCQLGNTTPSPSSMPSSTSFPTVQHIKQENTQQSSALQKLHQRLLQRLRKSQQDCPTQDAFSSLSSTSSSLPSSSLSSSVEPTQVVISESSKKADSSFNKVLELFSYYFNTQKTASPLACTAALYLGQVGFELQKRYEAYSRYIKCGVLEEMLVSITRATNLRKLGIKSYEEFLRAEVSELRRIKDPERYLNRRMQVFQSYEPEELEGVYLSFDALYLLAKKPPAFRTEWLEEGKVRIVHICEIHEAWRGSPLNKTKRARSPESEETSDGCTMPKAKVLKEEH